MGLFYKPVNTKLWKKKTIVLSDYIQRVLCIQKKAVLSVITVLLKYEICEFRTNKEVKKKPEEAANRKSLSQ